MAIRASPAASWIQNLGQPSRLFETSGSDYQLYEEDDEFVLSVELPGFEAEEITVSWDDGVLNVATDHEDEMQDRRRTYHRRFKFPKAAEESGIAAEYTNGILEVRLPVATEATVSGTEIEIDS